MGSRKRLMTGGVALGAGEAACKLLSLVRNIILARLLTEADLGIAATWAITMTLLDAVINVSADKLLVQSKDGDEVRFQATAQSFQVIRGALIAAGFFFFAPVIANLFQAPETTWSFRVFALIPLVKGFGHLDVRRAQREYRYAPFAIVEVVSIAASVLVVGPLSLHFEDYRGALGALLVYAFTWTAMTHLVAKRPYRWAFEPEHARSLLRFGWPLMLSGVLMFVVLSGDRVVIGTAYTPEDLGVYSVALILVAAPFTMAARVNNTLLLPVLARAQDDRELFHRRYQGCAEFLTLAATMFGILFIVGGPLLIELFYGSRWREAGAFIGWMAAMQAIGIMRIGPALGSMALADSKSLLITNIVRATSVGLMIAAALAEAPLVWIVISGAVGELLAHLTSIGLLRLWHGVPVGLTVAPSVIGGAGLGLAALYPLLGGPPMAYLPVAATTAGLCAGMMAVQVLTSTEMRHGLARGIEDLKRLRAQRAAAPEATHGGARG